MIAEQRASSRRRRGLLSASARSLLWKTGPYLTSKRVKKEYLKQKVKILTNGRVENGVSCRRVQSDGHKK